MVMLMLGNKGQALSKERCVALGDVLWTQEENPKIVKFQESNIWRGFGRWKQERHVLASVVKSPTPAAEPRFRPQLSRSQSLNCWSVQMILDLWLPAVSKTTFGLLNKVLTCLAVYSTTSAM